MIESAILGNDFLRNLSNEHIETIIDYMYLKEFRKDSMIIVEGDMGSHIYVLEGKHSCSGLKDVRSQGYSSSES